jgi:hypothetical protein
MLARLKHSSLAFVGQCKDLKNLDSDFFKDLSIVLRKGHNRHHGWCLRNVLRTSYDHFKGMGCFITDVIRGHIFSRVCPFYERAVSDLDRSMHRSLWV